MAKSKIAPAAAAAGLTGDRLKSLLAYCRLTEAELDVDEQQLITTEYAAAVSYMETGVCPAPEEGTPRRAQWDLCVNALVLDAWSRREATVDPSAVEDNPVFRRHINQLKMTSWTGF